uniref:Uncharacterized protein n=1 Tax=Coturnix japonica TaxID=93934 RepID=A0A8C2T703_COTJA
MATAAYVDHFAAECLVSMSSRAIIHSPKGETEPQPDATTRPSSNGEEKWEVRETGKDNGSSLMVVASILADLNQHVPNSPALKREKTETFDITEKIHISIAPKEFGEESVSSASKRGGGKATTPTSLAAVTEPSPRQKNKRGRSWTDPGSPQKKHKCHYVGCEKLQPSRRFNCYSLAPKWLCLFLSLAGIFVKLAGKAVERLNMSHKEILNIRLSKTDFSSKTITTKHLNANTNLF